MMKLLPVFLFLLLTKGVIAQNYECIKPNEKQYFIDGDNYLRGMRIDSTHVSGDTSFYYPYRTPRGDWNNLDLKGASWLGAEIIEMKSGVYWFFNNWNDTLEIRSKAKLNEKWVCFQDTNDIYYEAEVTSIDTAKIKGVVDSVKTITITAHGKNGVISTAPAHGLKCKVSKNNGFYAIRDLFFFPYHYPGDVSMRVASSDDYYTFEVGAFSQFKQVDFKNSRLTEIYDYNVGDIFFRIEKRGTPKLGYLGVLSYTYDSVVAISPLGSGNKITIDRVRYNTNYNPPPIGSSTATVTYNKDVVAVTIFTDTTFIISEFPEESGTNYIYYYHPDDSSYCTVSDLYHKRTNYIVGNIASTFEKGHTSWKYKKGIGFVDYEKAHKFSYPLELANDELKFIRKSGVNCGTYLFPTSVKNITNQQAVSIYPNPIVDNTVYVNMPKGNRKTCRLTIYDVVGRWHMTKDMTNSNTVDVSTLVSGVYLFVVVTEDEKIIKRVTVQ